VPEILVFSASSREKMLDHLASCLPEEACGFLGGSGERVRLVLPVANILHSPVVFRMDPAGQWNAMQTIKKRRLKLLGIYHSHPTGPSFPSETDVSKFSYPGVLSIICSREKGTWQMKAFNISSDGIIEVKLVYII
jgi:proteasome lid subunit RPN8/RPN11